MGLRMHTNPACLPPLFPSHRLCGPSMLFGRATNQTRSSDCHRLSNSGRQSLDLDQLDHRVSSCGATEYEGVDTYIHRQPYLNYTVEIPSRAKRSPPERAQHAAPARSRGSQ